ncbi:MAG TPA: adenosylhomocysteinase [Candidatus Thermoplasmatota archaeon]|nr:adenosylhomocysteinase [Candidatus Thermoplasmatota archaeon]
MTVPPHMIKDPSLAKQGRQRIDWAAAHMPVLKLIRQEFEQAKPLKGITIGACLHVTKETAVLMETLQAGGAKVALCGSNPLSTQDDVAAALAEKGIHVYAWRGVNNQEYYEHVDAVLQNRPTITMDDGGDLVTRLVTVHKDLIPNVLAGTEETTTGVHRFRAMAAEGVLPYPLVAVNDAMTKHFFDNRYGTGQSTLDGILRATSSLIAGSVFVVAGYGWVGKGLSMRARGMGARVVVTEVDAVRALEAVMDGFEVAPMAEAVTKADFVVTVTGGKWVLDKAALENVKDGAVLANSGHFDNEINLGHLKSLAKSIEEIRPNVEQYTLKDGRKVYVLGQGRLVNLAAAEGHPPQVMDMSFANQALSAVWLLKNAKQLEKKVYEPTVEQDQRVASLKLTAMGVKMDQLTDEQKKYLAGWQEGT